MSAIFLSKASIYNNDYNYIFRNKYNEMVSKLHYHDFFEIVIYLGNAGYFYINNQKYLIHRGDIVLINMFEPHTLIFDTKSDYERFSISIDPNLLLSFSTTNSNILDIFSKESKNYPLFHLDELSLKKYLTILNQFRHINLNHGKDILEKALLHQLIAYLFNDCYDGLCFNTTNSYHISLISMIVKFIDTHLHEQITLAKISSEVNYSTYYICKIFKKITNQTLTKYIIEKRIEKSTQYFHTSIPINKIAEMVGFKNYSYFYKTFKKIMGYSPEYYRKVYFK